MTSMQLEVYGQVVGEFEGVLCKSGLEDGSDEEGMIVVDI